MRLREDSPSWINREIIEEMYQKDDLYKAAVASGKEEDWKFFRVQNKRVKKIILEAKEEYIKELLEDTKDNPRKFWRKINEISGLGRNKKKKGLDNIVNEKGEELKNMAAAEYNE